jgi:hypothetical protein
MGVEKKEAKRLEKETKLAAKAVKGPAGTERKAKVDKVKKEGRDAEVEFVNKTPKGEKKGTSFPATREHLNYYTYYRPLGANVIWLQSRRYRVCMV